MTQISLNTTNKIKLCLDLIAGISILVLLSPPLTGITIHEWLGLAVIIPLLVHLLLNWQWIVVTTRRFFYNIPGRIRVNYALNIGLFILMTAEGFTGLMISKAVLPLFGLSASRNIFYRTLHSMLANGLLIVMGLHLAMNWKWVLNVLNKNILTPWRDRRQAINNTSSPTISMVKTK